MFKFINPKDPRSRLRSSTSLTVAFLLGTGAVGMTGVGVALTSGAAFAQTCAANPCAANNCAANPCAANPCAANPCAASGGAATGCTVPRLAQAAAANPCAACAPCAANPCAAACAAKNPCAADKCAANPCAAVSCEANPCAANPCAADKCAANPCAAASCEANPCAANPCAANPCAAAAPPPEVTDEELQALYECLMQTAEQQADVQSDADIVQIGWSQSELAEGREFASWANFAIAPYISFTHGERFATNHANAIAAERYGMYESDAPMPAGGIVAKPTFSINQNGEALWETLFLMEKAQAGVSPETNNWLYSAIMPDGSVMGVTMGTNANRVDFCAACHMGMGADSDDMIFLPDEYRVRN